LNDIENDLPLYGYSSTTLKYDEGDYSQKKFHKVEISNLLPEITYYYRCVSEDLSPVFSEERHFTLPKIEPENSEISQETTEESGLGQDIEDTNETIETIEEDQEEIEDSISGEIIAIEDISNQGPIGELPYGESNGQNGLGEVSEKEILIQSILFPEQKGGEREKEKQAEEEKSKSEGLGNFLGLLANIDKFIPNKFILFILCEIILLSLFILFFTKRKKKEEPAETCN
jgi:hypothetical protein